MIGDIPVLKHKYLFSMVTPIILTTGLLSCSSEQVQVVGEKEKVAEENQETTKEISITFSNLSGEEVNKQATLIVEGEPTKIVESRDDGTYPLTKFSFKVHKVLKGEKDSLEEIIVIQDGTHEVQDEGHPLMNIHEKYLLFLEKNKKGEFLMVGGPAGKYKYHSTKRTYINEQNEEVDGNAKAL